MPELPEVETIASDLNEFINGQKIKQIIVKYPKLVNNSLDYFNEILKGSIIKKVSRFGKMIHFELDNQKHALVHLKMTGQFSLDFWPQEQEIWPKHVHLAFYLNDMADSKTGLFYHDIRKFGWWRVFSETEFKKYLKDYPLGADPLSLDGTKLKEIIAKSRQTIKALLLNQKKIAGIGNIYADEILFSSKIHPKTPANKINLTKLNNLAKNTQDILKRSILARGSTVQNYQGLKGAGSFQEQHLIYGKSKENCPVCKTLIEKTTVAGRGSNFCPNCQKV